MRGFLFASLVLFGCGGSTGDDAERAAPLGGTGAEAVAGVSSDAGSPSVAGGSSSAGSSGAPAGGTAGAPTSAGMASGGAPVAGTGGTAAGMPPVGGASGAGAGAGGGPSEGGAAGDTSTAGAGGSPPACTEQPALVDKCAECPLVIRRCDGEHPVLVSSEGDEWSCTPLPDGQGPGSDCTYAYTKGKAWQSECCAD